VKSEEETFSSFKQVLSGQGIKFERVALVGVGNELNGDDAAGILAARKLSKIVRERETNYPSRSPICLVIEAGPAPEAFSGPLRRFQPDLIILIDAAELGQAPGTVKWLDWTDAEGMSASTHTLPPSIFAQFLVRELSCQVILAGIQPRHLEFEQAVSREVRAAVTRVVNEIARELN
jgi:hydrogenase 3 maturation protease